MTAAPTMAHPANELWARAAAAGLAPFSREFARLMDAADPLRALRGEFALPTAPAPKTVYLCGNSLGLQPKRTRELLREELDVWAERAVLGHFDHPKGRPWVTIDETVTGHLATLVGAAQVSEVAAMGSLSANLHFLLAAFYHPTPQRYKILIEHKAFPSDCYVVSSHTQHRGYKDGVVTIKPRPGEDTIRHEDILQLLRDQGHEIAVVMLSGVQYYTGQLFDIRAITKAAHDVGCVVGWDLAHAVGNVPLKLHEWNVDFAAWCTYKYLNAGPGCIAGIFVHANAHTKPALCGWWGHDKSIRFQMTPEFVGMPGAAGFQHSNPSMVSTVSLLGSLEVFAKTSMEALRAKSLLLTAYLELLIKETCFGKLGMRIITPADPTQRGAQLSLLFAGVSEIKSLMRELMARGVVVDERDPNVIRISPAPLYNNFEDVYDCVVALSDALDTLVQEKGSK